MFKRHNYYDYVIYYICIYLFIIFDKSHVNFNIIVFIFTIIKLKNYQEKICVPSNEQCYFEVKYVTRLNK